MKSKRGCVISLWHALFFFFMFFALEAFFMEDFFIGFHGRIGGILAEAITHGFSRRRPIRSLQIPPESGICPTDFTDLHRSFIIGIFCHADFADDADFFLIGFFYSSDDAEFIRRFPAEAITHGFSQMRPVRSLQIPPESGMCPTDFTDLHRLSLLQFHSLPSHFSFLICLSFLISHFSFLICH